MSIFYESADHSIFKCSDSNCCYFKRFKLSESNATILIEDLGIHNCNLNECQSNKKQKKSENHLSKHVEDDLEHRIKFAPQFYCKETKTLLGDETFILKDQGNFSYHAGNDMDIDIDEVLTINGELNANCDHEVDFCDDGDDSDDDLEIVIMIPRQQVVS